MGDYAECILKDDKRFDISSFPDWVLKERDNLTEVQREFVVELFKPVKDKIICLLTGNHEEALHLHKQDNFTKNICKDLGVTYGGYSCFVPLIFDRESSSESHQFIIHAHHGAGAAQSEGGRLMRLMRLVNDIQADIYLMGHLHTITTYTPQRLTLRNGKIKSLPLVAAMTGSWLKTYQQGAPASYAERAGYKPSVIGCPCIIINPAEQTITVES
uniref:Calcineurin-like phosphoesterase domain-containing protein n=1 Tax=viral metagenome TaxID=1070528 RepID=A0A6M3J2E5_9ZZZZ